MVSAAAVVERDGQFLMIRDTAQGRLVLPGGHLHWSESLHQGVCREVWEETGYRVEIGPLIAAYSSHDRLADPGIIRIIFAATITGGNEESSAEGNVEWPTVEQLEEERARDLVAIRAYLESTAGVSTST
jgi:ADP-ribose pyrophosphatase YjhB (NUDIX family)